MDRGVQQCKEFDTCTKYTQKKNSKLFTLLEFNVCGREKNKSIGGSGGVCQAHAPPWSQILSFLHKFLPKSAHVGGPNPPNGSTPPPTGNPGSATEVQCILPHPPNFSGALTLTHKACKCSTAIDYVFCLNL